MYITIVISESQGSSHNFMSTVPSHVPAVEDIILAKIDCCTKRCFSKLPGEQVRSARAMFTSKCSVDQRQWVLDYLNTHKEGKTVIYIIGKDSSLCEKAWRNCLALARTRYQKVHFQTPSSENRIVYSIFLVDYIIPSEPGVAFYMRSKQTETTNIQTSQTDMANSGNCFSHSNHSIFGMQVY